MGYVHFASALVALALLASADASAQTAPPPQKPAPSSTSQVIAAAPPPVMDQGAAGRMRAAKGDCVGALDNFDRALSVPRKDPDVRRDRGRCHDTLGHPYPAIDDYRAYLAARPDAPDAEAVRKRLEELETQVGQMHAGGAPAGDGSGSSVKVTAGFDVKGDVHGKDLATIEHDETLDVEAEKSPLRRGKGMILGLSVAPQVYGESAFGVSETAGIDLRYSFSRVSTAMLQVSFEHVNSSGTATSLGGGGALAGYEARIALDPRTDNAILVGGTIGYQHLSQGGSGFVYSVIKPQGRLGFRHVFGPTLGLEACFDGGAALLHLTGSLAGVTGADKTTSLIGGHIAFVLGF